MKILDFICFAFAVVVFHDLISLFYRDMSPYFERLIDWVGKVIDKYDID